MTLNHRPALRTILAAGLLLGLGSAVRAQPVSYVFYGPDGPSVLQVDGAGRPIVPPGRPDLAGPAIPVAEVMNGGGFGLTGFDYYNDQNTEGPFGKRRGPRPYVLAPAYAVEPVLPR